APGDPDTTFGTNGVVTYSGATGGILDSGRGVYVNDSDQIYAVGYSLDASNQQNMTMWKYNSDGTLDTSFDSDGIVNYKGAAGNNYDIGNSVIGDSQDRVVVVGVSRGEPSDKEYLTLWRYNSNGTLDTSFDNDGIVVSTFDASGRDITIDENGKIVVVGVHGGITVWRFNEDGTPDTSFNSTGMVVSKGVADVKAEGYSVYVDSSGKILASGTSWDNSNQRNVTVLRFNSDGTLDTAFANNGVFSYIFSGSEFQDGTGVYEDSSGRILLTGFARFTGSEAVMFLMRITPAGILDTTFDTDGIVTHSSPSGGEEANGASIKTTSNNKIVVSGHSRDASFQDYVSVWRFNDDGSFDTDFGNGNGFVSFSGGIVDKFGNTLDFDSNGNILVVGGQVISFLNNFSLWRLEGDPIAAPVGLQPGTYEEDYPELHYEGKWKFKTNENATDGAFARTKKKNSTVSFTLAAGTSELTLITQTSKKGGKVEVCIGENCQEITTKVKGQGTSWQEEFVFTVPVSSEPTEVTITNLKNKKLVVDAIVVD
ncbi:MAG TPA: hypothetical protein VGA67_05840, partial [Candidatus Dojkabacteria bacterium]